MVLIHGFGGDLDNWLFNIDALAAGRRVLALDLPGHGQSSKEVGDGSLATLAATVVGFLDALGVERAALVGHSMGAAVAMQVAADAPERVSGLGLIAAVGLGPEIDAEYIAGFVAAASRRELKPWVERLFADRALVTRQLVEDLLRYKRIDGVAEALGGLSRALIDAGQQRIGLVATARASRVPVVVIWGSADAIIPAAHAHALGDAARVVVIDGAGHMVQMEAASKVNAALLEHLG